MKNLSIRIIIGLLFSAVGLVSLFITQDALTAAIWLSFGNGLILSDLRFSETDAQGNVYAKPIPKARLYTAIFLIVLAVVLLGVQIIFDLQRAGGSAAV
ncbi:hypothetical protein POKO110462_11090 [Pontibacter korlensis]|uniref:Uncharacterized protein n=1 Tax=Pontibacter korlensis TaxID=400092 RepID=A0A0E3UXW9_9BACT|nr:hypothetical protein [Pontibacter korlensis]AKD04607.1 hypothetical protein PKOR_17790 [Pontibacter korlensis]